MDFAAIDFETANQDPASICSVGVVVVGGGEVKERIYRLIRPQPDYYSYMNTRIHGLNSFSTQNAPIFPQVWAEISKRIEGLTLVAHNAQFDERCLKAAHASYSMDYPGYEFLCTCRAARKAFSRKPSFLRPANFKLDTLAEYFSIGTFRHHNAIDDALVCARLALIFFGKNLNSGFLSGLENNLNECGKRDIADL